MPPRRLLTTALAILSAAAGFAQSMPTVRFTAKEVNQGYSNRTLLAKPRSTAAPGSVAAAESREGRRIRRTYPLLGNLRVIEAAAGESVASALQQLRASGRYEFVEPDFIRQRHAVPDDPQFASGAQWPLRNSGQESGVAGADIDAVAGWDVRTDASSVVVAVIDSGIRLTHEDLAANLWTNPGEIAGNGLDDDANGYVDDVHGMNSLVARGSAASGNPEDDTGHGTAVAGLVGALGNNGKGMAGVAWKVQIMPLKFDDAEGSATVSNEIECIDYAVAKGAQIINISYGSVGFSQAEYDAIKRARDAGVIIVTSAGNLGVNTDFYPSYPGNHLLDNVLTVASTDRNDALSTFSNFSSGLVDLAAPGTAVLSAGHQTDSTYEAHDGTSFSSPLVTGTLALMRAQFPTDNYRSLINRVLRHTDPLPALSGKVQTAGRLNLARALAATDDRPFNDDFAARGALEGVSVAVRGSTQQATSEVAEPAHANLAAGATIWWSWTPAVAGPAVAETTGSGFDTVVAVYTGGEFGTLVPVASNDDAPGATTSRASFAVEAGVTYHIAVGGKGTATGFVLLTVGFVPPNDAFATASTLTGASMRATGFNTGAGSEAGETLAETGARGRSVWFKWLAPETTDFTLSIFAYGFDAVAAVYRGTSLTGLTKLDTASTDIVNEPALFEAVAGATYYFQIDSADGTVGLFDLTVSTALPFPGLFPVHASPAFSVASNYLFSADAFGLLLAVRFDPVDVQLPELDGTLDVQSPALGPDGSVFIGDDFGYLHAYNADVTPRWKKTLGPTRVTSSAAIGADGAVYVHTDDGWLHGYHADGTQKWRAAVPGISYSSPSIGTDGTIYIGSDDEHLYALSPVDGALRWRFKAEGEIYSSPAIDAAGSIYFGTLDGYFYAISSAGQERWSYLAGGAISSSPALGGDGTVYFGCYDKNLYALTPTGILRWTYATGDEIRASSPAVATNGVIYIGSYDGYIHAVTSGGLPLRTFATGAYIRSSPLIHDGALFIGSGDSRLYIANAGANLASSPWPMHRQNPRRTGRALTAGFPTLLNGPVSHRVTAQAPASLGVNVTGGEPLSFQWYRNGTIVPGETRSTLGFPAASPGDAGQYQLVVTNAFGTLTSTTMILGLDSTSKLLGTGLEFPNIFHPGTGFTYDQILLQSASATVTADPGQILRMSYVDSNDDIVQVEFSGPGALSLSLENPSGPAAPVNYNQPAAAYLKGRASIVLSGATENTHLSVFSVGRANAANQGLFYDSVTYDGRADIGYIAILSADGKFGGLRTANTIYSASQGITGVHAPGVEFTGPVFVGDIDATGSAEPVLLLGGGGDIRITGGDLRQTNSRTVEVAGIAQLNFTAGGTSHNVGLPAQMNAGRLVQNGTDVTTSIVVNPVP